MKKQITFALGFWAYSLLLPCQARALMVSDALTKAQDKIEETTEILKMAQEKVSDAEAKMRDSKIGEFGKKAMEGYNYINDRLTMGRNLLAGDLKLSPLDVPSYLSGKTNDVDAAQEVIKTEYIAKYGSGDDTTKSKHQKRQDMEAQHNNVATIYAKAYSIRYYLKKARQEQPDPQVDLEDSRKLIQAGRAYAESTNRRLLDMIAMEMALLEFESSEVVFASKSQRNDLATVDEGD